VQRGFDPQYGARPLKRVIQKDIINLLSKKIIQVK
jgi:ATP-dependent Clp protease ATP-binding subunit ClpB